MHPPLLVSSSPSVFAVPERDPVNDDVRDVLHRKARPVLEHDVATPGVHRLVAERDHLRLEALKGHVVSKQDPQRLGLEKLRIEGRREWGRGGEGGGEGAGNEREGGRESK